jgi:hypothetical protein
VKAADLIRGLVFSVLLPLWMASLLLTAHSRGDADNFQAATEAS